MTDRNKAFVSIILYTLIGGAIAPLTKIGLREIQPLNFVFLRFLLASLCLLPFILKKKLKINYREIIPISLLATINVTFFTFGVKSTTGTISAILYAGTPLITGIILFLFMHQRLNNRKTAGLLIGFLGVIFIVLLPVLDKENIFSGNLIGNLLISIAVISWSFYMVFSKKLLEKYSPFVITSFFIFITTVVLFPLFLVELNRDTSWLTSITGQGVFSLVYMAFFGTIGSYLLNQYAIKHRGSVFASMSFYLGPVSTYAFSYFLIGEQLTQGIILGAIISLLGVYLVTREK